VDANRGDWDLIANKAGVTRLGFAVMLKFYEIEGRFPAYPEEVPPAAVRYVGSLVKVDPALFAKYSWAGRSIKYHRSQIRKVYGTRPPTEDDEDRWAQWLAGEICPTETNRERLAAALRRRCRSEKVEPPGTGQVERVVASGGRRFDDAFAATTAGRLGPMVCGRLEDLLARPNVLAGKNIGAIQLYAPDANQAAWPRLEKILKKRPITGERHLFEACTIP
jgi:hypothetical protein